ncbi:MAG: fused MFS/spermidine synthase [Polyangiales bacterium]
MTKPDDAPSARRDLQALLVPFLCFFLSGASGLVFEVIWTRMLTLVFGASTPAISTVLSAFMGGLALGSFIFGRFADRLKFPIVTYAAMEAGVGVFSLLIPVVVRNVYPPVSHWITNHGGNRFDVFTLLRFAVVALVLLPPTTLMGATLPLLAKHFVKQGGRVGQRVGALYAVNTFGAVAGTFLAGFFLLPGVGLAWTNALAGCTNLTLAALIYLFRKPLLGGAWPTSWRELLPEREAPAAEASAAEAKKDEKKKEDDKKDEKKDEAKPDAGEEDDSDEVLEEKESAWVRYATLAAAAGSGFAALSYEVILSRALDMVIGSSIYSFTIILMGFLIGIGGGSALASAILRARPTPGMTAAVAGAVEALALLQFVIYQTNLARLVWAATTVVVLLGTAIAATWRRPVLALGVTQLLIAAGAIVTYFFQDRIPRMFVYLALTSTTNCDPSETIRFSEHIGAIQLLSFLVALLCALPAAVGMGAAFPLGVRAFARGAARVGSDTGSVYSVNTVGSIAGSFLMGFVIMPAVGMETAMYVAVAVNLGLALLLFLASPGEEPVKYVLVPLAAVLLAVTGTGAALGREGRVARSQGSVRLFPRAWDQAEMTTGVFRLSLADGMVRRRGGRCVEDQPGERRQAMAGDNPIYYRDGVTTTVTVERWNVGDALHFALKNNGKVDASNGDDMPTQVLVGAYPLLLHPRGPQGLDVAVVGFGSGVTIGTTLQFPVRRVDVIELERWIPDASRFFADVNHLTYTPERAFPYVSMPRLSILNNDGRNFLAATDRRYDVVISEPSNPWITGVSNMFTADHFRAATQALSPDGVYVQWVQLYEMSPDNIKSIYRTFASVFPYVRVFAADAYSSDTIMLGSFRPLALDPRVLDQRLADPGIRAAVEPSHATSGTDLLARMLFASREEVMRFATLEERLERGEWRPDLRATGLGECSAPACRRRPAPVNTDDNALIEFAAPRDLIGFDAFTGYVETMYSDEWRYGRVEQQVVLPDNIEERVRVRAQLGVSLLAAGRPRRAGEVLDETASMRGPGGVELRVPEMLRAAALWNAITAPREPTVHLEAPTPSAALSPEGARALQESFDRARQAIDNGSYNTALETLLALPANVREQSGAGIRMMFGFLLYRASLAEGAEPRFAEAAEALEQLQRDEPAWCERHPEVNYLIGRARFRNGDFARSVQAMGRFVDQSRTPTRGEHEALSVPRDLDEPAAEAAPVTDEPGESDKDLRPGAAPPPTATTGNARPAP